MVTKKEIFKKNRTWLLILSIQVLLFYLFSKSEFLISGFEFFFNFQKNIHIFIFSIFPFSAGDFFYILIFLFIFYILFKILSQKNKKQSTLKLLIFINIFYFSYQIFWGMLYSTIPILPYSSWEKIDEKKLKKLCYKYLIICKNQREKTLENKNGIFKINSLKNIESEIIKNQKYIPFFSNIHQKNTHLSIKKSIFSKTMNHTGILGYYNPFTAEAQYNSHLPESLIPFTIAHESAHQMGYAREEEANFIGFLLGKNSQNIDLQYSTNYFALKKLIRATAQTDSVFAKKIMDNFSEKMKKDYLNEKKFIEENQGFITDLSHQMNDFFLKSNGQDGIITYSYFVNLLLWYEDK